MSAFQSRRSRHNTGELQNSSSFDNLYSLMNKRMDSKYDENKPKWVMDLIEKSKSDEDRLSYQEESNSRRDTIATEVEFEPEPEDETLNVSKASSENLLEIKSSEDGVVKFRKKSLSPEENRKIKQKFDETVDSREFESSGYGEQAEGGFNLWQNLKQYFAKEKDYMIGSSPQGLFYH